MVIMYRYIRVDDVIFLVWFVGGLVILIWICWYIDFDILNKVGIIKINDKFIFTGDSLIPKIETITRLPGGSRKIYEEKTLPIIKALDGNNIIFPGHGLVCTMQDVL